MAWRRSEARSHIGGKLILGSRDSRQCERAPPNQCDERPSRNDSAQKPHRECSREILADARHDFAALPRLASEQRIYERQSKHRTIVNRAGHAYTEELSYVIYFSLEKLFQTYAMTFKQFPYSSPSTTFNQKTNIAKVRSVFIRKGHLLPTSLTCTGEHTGTTHTQKMHDWGWWVIGGANPAGSLARKCGRVDGANFFDIHHG